MNHKPTLLFAGAVTLSLLSYVAYHHLSANDNNEAQFTPATGVSTQPALSAEHHHDKLLSQKVLNNQLPATSANLDEDQMAMPDEDNPYATEAVKAQLMQIADMYEEASRYPASSQPITSKEDLKRFLPPEESATEMPFPLENSATPVVLSVKLAKRQVFEGQPVEISVALKNLPASPTVSARATITAMDGTTLWETPLDEVAAANSKASFTGKIDTDSGVAKNWPPEMQVLVTVDVDEHRLISSVPLRFNPPSALLTDVESPLQSEAYLKIPLRFSVQNPGYFFISANLFSASTGEPVAHLEGQGRMNHPKERLFLDAHATALQVSGDEGPYILKNVSITRAAEDNEDYDLAGMSIQDEWPIDGFHFDSYDKTPYVDELAQERTEFLRKLGQL
ncbi:MAG: hypothetical protein H7A01_17720 [Hahellaceae bacterium]|nr:hypothetical protein [Hahellaceae bacterium]MCP5212146.1 hypothetical protein [Hahellaceae bacterium]